MIGGVTLAEPARRVGHQLERTGMRKLHNPAGQPINSKHTKTRTHTLKMHTNTLTGTITFTRTTDRHTQKIYERPINTKKFMEISRNYFANWNQRPFPFSENIIGIIKD